MVDIARLVSGFDGMKNEYLNTDDKTNTKLYLYIRDNGADLSCVMLKDRNNVEVEVALYRKKENFKGTTLGVAFTMNGTDYALLSPEYNPYTQHISLHINDDHIKMVCDAMVENGISFNSDVDV